MTDRDYLISQGFCPNCTDRKRGSMISLYFRVDVTTNGHVVEECRTCDYSALQTARA